MGRGKGESSVRVYTRLAPLADLFSSFFPTAEPVHRLTLPFLFDQWFSSLLIAYFFGLVLHEGGILDKVFSLKKMANK